MAFLNLLSSPLSLYAIPAMWVISYYPGIMRTSALKKAGEYDTVQPRNSYSTIAQKKAIPPALNARLQRMDAAHSNGLESLPFFGIAVLAGNYARMDPITLNVASGFYLIARIAYNYFYINQHDVISARPRAGTWLISLLSPFYILFKSASLLSQS